MRHHRVCIAALSLILLTWSLLPRPAQAAGVREVLLPILMYHAVSLPPADLNPKLAENWLAPEKFRCQLRWLADNGYQTVSPEQLIEAVTKNGPLPAKPIMITFDDGYADAAYSVTPILREFGYTGVFFVITGWLNEGRPDYLSWAQARAMAEAGMSIQSHSRQHVDMRGKPDAWLDGEIQGSLNDIEANVGVRPVMFSYPLGRYDSAMIRALRRAGVPAAVTVRDGRTIVRGNLLWLPRVRVRGSTTLSEFAYLVTRRVGERLPTPTRLPADPANPGQSSCP